MSKIQLLKVFLNQRLTAVAQEIFGAVEQTIADYQEECSRTKEENHRLQKLLDVVIEPELKLYQADLHHLTGSGEQMPAEKQFIEKWGPLSLDKEDTELTQINKPEEPGTSRVKEELPWQEEGVLCSVFVKNNCHQDLGLSSDLASTSTEQMHTELDEDLQQHSDLGKVTCEKQRCEKWSPPSLRPEDPELIKNRQEELGTSQTNAQIHWLEESVLSPSQLPHLRQSVENQHGDIFSTTGEQIKTERGTEDYTVPELNNYSQSLSAGHPKCSAAQTDNSEDPGLERGPHSPGSKIIHTVQDKRSYIGANHDRKSMEMCCGKLPVGESQRQDVVRLCYCKVCWKPFNSMVSLVSHQKMHVTDKEHICGVCEKCFDSTASLQGHLQIHIDAGFSCHICHERFRMSTEMVTHMATHKVENPFKCSSCGKGFSNSSNLTKHIRSHTGEKPYQCPHCGKRFSNSSNMKVHIMCHTGEKPFACRFCGKGFIQKATMELHIMIHTGEKPHGCRFCGKCFRHGSELKVHTRRHTGEKPLDCRLSVNRFSAHASLKSSHVEKALFHQVH